MLTGLTTPGTRTSEFLLVVLNAVAQLVLALTNVLPTRYAATLGIIGAVAYQLSRGLAKTEPRNPTTTPPTA